MGFVKCNIQLEQYLDSTGIDWQQLSDSEYRKLLTKVVSLVNSSSQSQQSSGDKAFEKLTNFLPVSGYLFSAPNHKLLSVEPNSSTFGYKVSSISNIDRATLNQVECVLVDDALSFIYVFNHEWQASCPELLIENHV